MLATTGPATVSGPDLEVLLRSIRHGLLHARHIRGLRNAVRSESCVQNRYYRDLVIRYGCRRVVETGVQCGASTAYLLRGLAETRGHLWSVDLPTLSEDGNVNADGRRDRAHVRSISETGCLVPRSLRSGWTLKVGDCKDLLAPTLEAAAPVHMVVLDDDHSSAHVAWELEMVWPCIRPGGLLVCDDVDWSNAWFDFVGRVGVSPSPFPGTLSRQYVVKRPAHA